MYAAVVQSSMNGVSPEDADWSSVSSLGSENRTRFLDLLGVAGGVDMLWHPDFEARGLIRNTCSCTPGVPKKS
jgi:hypothetical protein